MWANLQKATFFSNQHNNTYTITAASVAVHALMSSPLIVPTAGASPPASASATALSPLLFCLPLFFSLAYRRGRWEVEGEIGRKWSRVWPAVGWPASGFGREGKERGRARKGRSTGLVSRVFLRVLWLGMVRVSSRIRVCICRLDIIIVVTVLFRSLSKSK